MDELGVEHLVEGGCSRLVATGYPSDDATVPLLEKKTLGDFAVVVG